MVAAILAAGGGPGLVQAACMAIPAYKYMTGQDTSIPRRADMRRWIPAEKAIYDAMQVVEGTGAHPSLTAAVVALSDAKDKVADFVDLEIGRTEPHPVEKAVAQSKGWRQRLDAILQEMKDEQAQPQANGGSARHLALSVTHLEDAIMRQGMRMKELDKAKPGAAPTPYPKSYDPSNPTVEKTADNLKL
jgi:hypothetical protein